MVLVFFEEYAFVCVVVEVSWCSWGNGGGWQVVDQMALDSLLVSGQMPGK